MNDITMYVVIIVMCGSVMAVYYVIQSLLESACGLVKRWWISRSRRER